MAKKENKKEAKKKRERVGIYLGIENGKKKYKYFYGSTKKEANAKAKNYKTDMDKGMNLLAEDTSFGFMLDTWLEAKKAEVSFGRYQCYDYSSKKFDCLRNNDIKLIRTADLQKIINEWSVMNTNTGRPSSRTSLKEMKLAASQIFQMAIDNRIIDYNPAKAIKIPKKEEESSRRALTDEEQQWIVNTPHRAQRMAMVMLYAGLRRGEIIPLTWADFLRDKKALNVNKSASLEEGKLVVKPHTKNGRDRVVYIPDNLFDYLCEEFKKAESIYMFPSAKGDMMTTNSFRRLWDSYMTELNLKYAKVPINARKPTSKYDPIKFPMLIPGFTPHWLRHTYATMLYHSGIDVLAARDQLGHKDIETTLQIYTHLDELHKTRALGKLNTYLKSINE